MDLVIIRHADAGDAEQFAMSGQHDDFRPLSHRGRRQAHVAAKALRELVPDCDAVVTSTLLRAVQTGELVSAAYGLAGAQKTGTLVPGSELTAFESWLAQQFDEDACVAAVGHEPHLSTLVTWLMTGTAMSSVGLKKGAACLLEFNGPAKAGTGTLRWLLTQKHLGRVAEGIELA